MAKFDKFKYGELHDQDWVKKIAKRFQTKINKLSLFHCPVCYELWPSENNRCVTCEKDAKKWSRGNDMVPNLNLLCPALQKCFEDFTMIEEQLISPISAIMSIYRLAGGHLFNRGFCASFTKDLRPLCRLLPRLPKDVSIIVIKTADQVYKHKQFEVNRQRIELVLNYLCSYNELWKAHVLMI